MAARGLRALVVLLGLTSALCACGEMVRVRVNGEVQTYASSVPMDMRPAHQAELSLDVECLREVERQRRARWLTTALRVAGAAEAPSARSMDATVRSNRRHSGISRARSPSASGGRSGPHVVRAAVGTPRDHGDGLTRSLWPACRLASPGRWLRPPQAGLVGHAGGWVPEAAGHAASGGQPHSSPRFLQARLSFWIAPPTDLPLRRLPYRCSLTACWVMPRRSEISRWFRSAR